MSTMKLSTQDKKELEQFTKFLYMKSVQLIVQSRLGEKIKTCSKSHSSGADWFNLSIQDLPEVQIETKKVLAGQITSSVGFTLCVEISLKTVEGDTLVLETWVLEMSEQCDMGIRIIYTVYNRMSLLLKSLIAITRVTPAYKLSSRQGPDSYVICYRMYIGYPQYHLLGDGYQESKVGQVGSPIGTVSIKVAYRTKMTITPRRTEKESPIMVKSDYFKPDMSPKRLQRPLDSHAFNLDINPLEEVIPPYDGLDIVNGDDSSHVKNSHYQHCPHPCPLNEVGSGEQSWNKQNGEYRNSGFNCHRNLGEARKVGAFAPILKEPDPSVQANELFPDTPFLSLLQHDSDNNPVQNKKPDQEDKSVADKNANLDITVNKNASADKEQPVDYNYNTNDILQRSSSCSDGLEDFVMIEFKPPFAEYDGNNDLGTFFRECQSAPPLESFVSQQTLEEQVTEISCQLAMFETSLQDFDQFVENICHNES